MTFALKLRSQHTTTGVDHPSTSHAAAARVRPKTGTQRARVLEAIESYGGLTDDEIVAATGLGPNSVRPRRRELQGMGLIVASGVERRNALGNLCMEWVPA